MAAFIRRLRAILTAPSALEAQLTNVKRRRERIEAQFGAVEKIWQRTCHLELYFDREALTYPERLTAPRTDRALEAAVAVTSRG